MKTRIIVAAIFVPLIFVVLFFLPPVAVTLMISAISALAARELLKSAAPSGRVRLQVYAAIAAAAVPVGVLLGPGDMIFRGVLFLLATLLAADAVVTFGTTRAVTLTELAAALFGGAVIPYFLSAIVGLRLLDNGAYYALIPFVTAFVTDGGAYFSGVFFGKSHPFPRVSPKKTTAGCVGGILTCVAACAGYGAILQAATPLPVRIPVMALYGLLGGVVTELGDLAFSLIKRTFGVKDFGALLPGHGGMLDRFDSMIFAAPLIYLLITLLPAF